MRMLLKCNYPHCEVSENLSVAGLCPRHHIDYPEKKVFNKEEMKKRFQVLAAQAPENSELEFEQSIKKHVFDAPKPVQESLL